MSEIKNLADDHWNYIKELLLIHGECIENVQKLGFHYRSAFINGYKHGVEDSREVYGDLEGLDE